VSWQFRSPSTKSKISFLIGLINALIAQSVKLSGIRKMRRLPSPTEPTSFLARVNIARRGGNRTILNDIAALDANPGKTVGSLAGLAKTGGQMRSIAPPSSCLSRLANAGIPMPNFHIRHREIVGHNSIMARLADDAPAVQVECSRRSPGPFPIGASSSWPVNGRSSLRMKA
jgi:hypothetical protein